MRLCILFNTQVVFKILVIFSIRFVNFWLVAEPYSCAPLSIPHKVIIKQQLKPHFLGHDAPNRQEWHIKDTAYQIHEERIPLDTTLPKF